MRQLVAVAAGTLTAASVLAGCGGTGPSAGESSGPTDSGSTATPSTPSGTSTPGDSPASNPLSRSHPAHLELVRADQLVTGHRCRAAPRRGLVCGPGGASLRFDPGTVQRVGVVKVAAAPAQQSSSDWTINLAFAPAGTRALAMLTRTATRTRESAVLMLPGSRRVLVAAQVRSAITDGNVQVTGGYTRASARRIVRLVTATAG